MPAAPLPQFPPEHSLFRMEWSLISALHPLTGSRASGLLTATVASGSTPVTVFAGWYAVPVIGSEGGEGYLAFDRMVKVAAETIVDPVANPAGTDIPFVSVVGGIRQNLDASTRLRWYPEPPPGLSEMAISAAGSSGATDPTGMSGIKQVLSWEGLGQQAASGEIWKAGTDDYPAVIIGWVNSPDGQMYGVGKTFQWHTFHVFVVVTRFDGAHFRRDEGKIVLSAVQRELGFRAEVDGEIFSSPQTKPGALDRLALDPGSYVYRFALQVAHTAKRIERRTAPALASMRMRMQTPDDGTIQPPDAPIDIVDTTEPVPG